MSRPTPTLKRLERLLVLVPWLLDNPGVAVEEVCERFSVSRDELLDDLDLLGYCGLPGYGGGDLVEVSVFADQIVVRMAEFFRRPLRLSVREAVTLLLAARAFSGVPGMGESAVLRRATEKLEALLGGAEDVATPGQPPVTVDLHSEGEEHLSMLRAAVEEGRVVRVSYRSASRAELTTREVEPWAVTGARGAWYLQGYCRLAEGPRDFRLDRIRDIEDTGERVSETPRANASPDYRPHPDDHEVVLDLDPPAWWIGDWARTEDSIDDGERRRVTFRTPDLEWAARLVLRAAPAARIVAPDALRHRLHQVASRTVALYSHY